MDAQHSSEWHQPAASSPLIYTVNHREERGIARESAMTDRLPARETGEPWTLEAAKAFVARYDAEVTKAVNRLQEQLTSAHPLGTVYVYRYTADAMTRYRQACRRQDGQAMAHVEVREPTGECYSGTVLVRWDDGTIAITENPPIPS